MKILALSDWRIQSLQMLRNIIQKEEPDLLLYAGDDLAHLLESNDKLYLNTYNNFIEIDINKKQKNLDILCNTPYFYF